MQKLKVEYDCNTCHKQLECYLRDIPNYCPLRDAPKGRAKPVGRTNIVNWGQRK